MSQTFAQQIQNLLDTSCPLVVVETHEESRCLSELNDIVTQANKGQNPGRVLATWDIARGAWAQTWDSKKDVWLLSPSGAVERINEGKDLNESLEWLAKLQTPAVVIVLDAHRIFKAEGYLEMRAVRNMIPDLKARGQMLVFLSPSFEVPEEWRKDVHFAEFKLPEKDHLEKLFSAELDNLDRKLAKIRPEVRERIVAAATGLTCSEASDAFALAMVRSKRERGDVIFDRQYAAHVFEEKISVMKNSLLDYAPTPFGFDAVGGFSPLKKWIHERRRGFDAEAREMKLPLPKGVILGGFQGTGKTTLGMAMANEMGFPFFKLDIGRLFGSLVGQSEARVRELIRVLEGIGEAVVLIDEMEKFLSSAATSGAGDSGASSRVFGTLVSWMATKTCPVFIVATVNHVDRLPPELIRKGRFDELWWCDLPGDQERESIFRVLLKHKFKRDWDEIPRALVEKTKDFSGAEIEACIVDALYECLTADVKSGKLDEALQTQLLEAVLRTRPQAQLNPERVTKTREFVSGKLRVANDASEAAPVSPAPMTQTGRKINVTRN